MDKRRCLVTLCVVTVLLAACKSGARRDAYTPSDAQESDSLFEQAEQAESLKSMETNESMPVAADELFDDFFFNYAANRRLQLERTVFPLPVTRDGQIDKSIERKDWKTEPFFMTQDYYTLFFDSPQQMELAKDTTVSRVVVEHINMDEDMVCQYGFRRDMGLWMLSEIKYQPLPRNPYAQFLKFYRQFVTDSVFQRESLAEQIEFVGPDPDDDFRMIEGVITPDFWDGFAPDLPGTELFNIVYGHQNAAAAQIVFVIRGIANGMEVEMTFRMKNGRWKLTKLIT